MSVENDTLRAAQGKPLWKAPKGQAKVERIERQTESDRLANRALHTVKLAKAREMAETRRAIYARDGGSCRACGRSVELESRNPAKVMHWHHLVYRSAGGDDSMNNGLTLCWKCHRLEHDHRYKISGTGAHVTLTEKNLTTGKIVREWESVVKLD